jgi:predicted nucleic acid-binding protein
VIVVDTSVWVDFFRGRNSAVVRELSQLLDDDEVALAAPVRLEILGGASRTELPRLRRLLSALPLLVPSGSVWGKLEGWVEQARATGERFFALDLLIAGIAHEGDFALWSLDTDFRRMAALGFVQLHRVRANE